MGLPKFLQPYLASYDLNELGIQGDRKLIITELLNKGDNKALEWLVKTYTKNEIKDIVSNPTRGFWLEDVLGYWQLMFGVKLKPELYKNALINLEV